MRIAKYRFLILVLNVASVVTGDPAVQRVGFGWVYVRFSTWAGQAFYRLVAGVVLQFRKLVAGHALLDSWPVATRTHSAAAGRSRRLSLVGGRALFGSWSAVTRTRLAVAGACFSLFFGFVPVAVVISVHSDADWLCRMLTSWQP